MTAATPAPHRVLVVDDEPTLVRALAIHLRARGWQVSTAADARAALEAAAGWRPDVVVLDLGLPDLDGVGVIAGLRDWSRVPIIVLSARQESEAKVLALDAGADDYVTKPFGMDELLARLRAAVRRAAPAPADVPVVRAGELAVDLARKKVTRAGADVRLTPTEWGVLEVRERERGRLVGARQLLQEGVGAGVRHRDELPAAVPGPAAPQARARPGAPAAPAHRAGDGLPLRGRLTCGARSPGTATGWRSRRPCSYRRWSRWR